MKVKCPDCRKRFEYELYSGVCPKCGNYMRPPQIETSENENCEMEGSHIHTESAEEGYTATYAQPESYSESYIEPEPSSQSYTAPEMQSVHVEQPKKRKSNPVITTILAVLMVTTFLVTIIVVYVGQKKVHDGKSVQEFLTPVICQVEEGFTYMTDYNKYDIFIDSVTVDEDPEFNLPSDYEVIVISYHIERTYLNNGGNDYDSYYEIQMSPYLETLSGHYLEPVSEYELRKVKNIQDYEQADAMGLSQDFGRKEGKLYYYVKKDDIKGLYITNMEYDREKYRSGALREIIRVEGLEVTR